MIKSDELMVGNLLKLKNPKFLNLVAVNEVKAHHIYSTIGQAHFYEELEGVLITEELLKIIGVEVVDDNPKQKAHYAGDIKFTFCGFEFMNSQKAGSNDAFYSYELSDGNTYYRYIHELQNLYFALRHETLVIKL